MKNIFILLAVSLITTVLTAQKVEVKDDKILVDGTEYAILKKTSGGMAEHAEFSLQTLDGEEVALAKVSDDIAPNTSVNTASNVQTRYVHITFLGSENQASMEYGIGFKKQFAKEVVKCNMFEDGKYNAGGEKKFLILNPFKGNQTVIVNGGGGTAVIINNNNGGGNNRGGNNGYNLVQRNRSGMIQVIGDDVMQDNKTIGSVDEDSGFNGGKTVKTYTFSLPDGTQVAVATVEGINTKTATVVTAKDNRTFTLPITSNYSVEKEIAKYLISKFYL